MSLGDGFHFAYICILPPQIKPGKYANAEAQVMAEVFIVITSGSSTLQRLRRTRVTATSGRLGVGREERVEAEGVGVGIKVCNRLPFIFFFFFTPERADPPLQLLQHPVHTQKSDYPSSHHTGCFNYQLHPQCFGRRRAKMYSEPMKT